MGQEFLGEHPEDRAFRHAIEGKLQFATVENLNKLTASVDKLAVTVDTMQARTLKTDEKLEEVRGWLLGEVSANGDQHPGVLSRMNELNKKASTAGWLLSILVGVSITKLVGDWFLPTLLSHWGIKIVGGGP